MRQTIQRGKKPKPFICFPGDLSWFHSLKRNVETGHSQIKINVAKIQPR